MYQKREQLSAPLVASGGSWLEVCATVRCSLESILLANAGCGLCLGSVPDLVTVVIPMSTDRNSLSSDRNSTNKALRAQNGTAFGTPVGER